MYTTAITSPETERLRALHGYGVLDTPPEAAFDELTALAARICSTPISLVTLIDDTRQWFKARHGFTLTETPRTVSFCAHAVEQPTELLVVPDATRDARFAANPLVTGEPGIRFYAGVPLCTPEGQAVGALCVIDRQPRTFGPDQQEALRMLGRQVMAQLGLRRSLNETILNFARLKNSQRIAGLGDWEYDMVNHRLVWSEEVYRILGLARKEVAPNAETFDGLVHPDDRALVQEKKKAVAEGARRVDYEHRIIRPDGEVRYFHQITEMSFDGQGRPVRQSGTMQDITARKHAEGALRQSEERFKFVARAVSDVVWDWDLTANTLWWNDGFLTTFGFAAGEIAPSFESRIGRIHPDERPRVVSGMHHAIATGAESWSAEYRFERKDGSHAFVQDRGFILRDATGKGIRMVGGMRDLTEQKKMEVQHLRAERMESIGTLAGGIAHDLNNVLTPIMLSIELLKLNAGDDPRRGKILDTIYRNSRRGADLVRQVLSFARGLDGKRVALRLSSLVDDLKVIISETFPRNIRIVAGADSNLWPIMGDPTQLHQVLLNLAVNARDAMPHGGTLTLAATNATVDAQFAGTSQEGRTGLNRGAKAGPHVLLQVTDTGTGISPEVRERIFEPFFTTKEFGKGTGIGLATVHTVVKRHDGFLNVESEVGRGTTFKIYLPADPALRSTVTANPFGTALPSGRGELVLVVDDELSIRDITQQTLEAFGYRVITASNGAEAVALYAQQSSQIGVVLTDMMMPVMNGAALIQVLTHMNPSIKIIAASGNDSGDTVINASKSGIKHFLLKPYTAETLFKLIREVLDNPIITAAA